MWREAWRAALRSGIHTALVIATTFVAVIAVVLQYGQSSHRAGEIHETFQRPEYRTVGIVDERIHGGVRAQDVVGLDRYSVVQRSWGQTDSFDVVNSAVPERGRVAAAFYAGDLSHLPIDLVSGRLPENPHEALAPDQQREDLGLDEVGGAVQVPSGREFVVVGYYRPEHDRAPSTILIPAAAEEPMASVWMELDDASQRDNLVRSVVALLNMDRQQVTVSVASGIADLGLEIKQGQYLTTVVTIGVALLISLLILGFLSAIMVSTRKQEFGRRRALGASRIFIFGVISLQIAGTVLAGAVLGVVVGGIVTGSLWPLGMPTWQFCVGLVGVVTIGSILAQLPAAVLAAFRDPVAVLRTP